MWEQPPSKPTPSKDNASKEEKATAGKMCSSLKDDPIKFETLAH
jgi:hypothetical protein